VLYRIIPDNRVVLPSDRVVLSHTYLEHVVVRETGGGNNQLFNSHGHYGHLLNYGQLSREGGNNLN
jgi:hypothetical protein